MKDRFYSHNIEDYTWQLVEEESITVCLEEIERYGGISQEAFTKEGDATIAVVKRETFEYELDRLPFTFSIGQEYFTLQPSELIKYIRINFYEEGMEETEGRYLEITQRGNVFLTKELGLGLAGKLVDIHHREFSDEGINFMEELLAFYGKIIDRPGIEKENERNSMIEMGSALEAKFRSGTLYIES